MNTAVDCLCGESDGLPFIEGVKMKFKSFVVVLAAAGLCATSFVGAEEGEEKAKGNKKAEMKKILEVAKCPLSGRPVDPEKTVAYKDSKVFVCCGNCVKGFEAAAKKKPEVVAKSNHQLVMTKQARQTKCALNGKGKINKETKTKVVGVEVNTCCKNCLGKLTEMKPEEQVELVFGKNFDKAFVVKAQKRKEKKEKAAKKAA